MLTDLDAPGDMAISPDGRTLAVVLGENRVLLLWDPPPSSEDPSGGFGSIDPAGRAAAARAEGERLQAEGRYANAIAAYRKSLAAVPDDALTARIETLERYLAVSNGGVPPEK